MCVYGAVFSSILCVCWCRSLVQVVCWVRRTGLVEVLRLCGSISGLKPRFL